MAPFELLCMCVFVCECVCRYICVGGCGYVCIYSLQEDRKSTDRNTYREWHRPYFKKFFARNCWPALRQLIMGRLTHKLGTEGERLRRNWREKSNMHQAGE